MSVERLMDLLTARALGALEHEEHLELAELESRYGSESNADGIRLSDWGRQLEMTAVEVHASLAEESATELTPEFTKRLVDQGAAFLSSGSSAGPSHVDPARRRPRSSDGGRAWSLAGWLVAAAALVLLFLQSDSWRTRDPEPTAAEAREALLASATELVEVTWAATEDPLVSEVGVTGDVVWSNAEQRGFVRLTNMPVNDASREQYQLWIFDRERSADHPVSGGVFDVESNGEVVIPLRAAFDIADPFLFAVTVERTGGVVVSEREHLVLLASVPE